MRKERKLKIEGNKERKKERRTKSKVEKNKGYKRKKEISGK